MFAVFTLVKVEEDYFMKVSKSKGASYIVMVQTKNLEAALSSDVRELVDDFNNQTFKSYNSKQKIPKTTKGFSFGKENGVPLARLYMHEREIIPSFSDGRTRTAFLIHKKISSFPVLTDKSSAIEMKTNNLIDPTFGIINVADIFDSKSAVNKSMCQGFQQQDYLPSNPEAKAKYLKHIFSYF